MTKARGPICVLPEKPMSYNAWRRSCSYIRGGHFSKRERCWLTTELVAPEPQRSPAIGTWPMARFGRANKEAPLIGVGEESI